MTRLDSIIIAKMTRSWLQMVVTWLGFGSVKITRTWFLYAHDLCSSVERVTKAVAYAPLSLESGDWVMDDPWILQLHCYKSLQHNFPVSAYGTRSFYFVFSLPGTIGPGIMLGSSVAMVDTSMFPILAQLVDTRHTLAYGSVSAIGDASFCVAFIIGKFSHLRYFRMWLNVANKFVVELYNKPKKYLYV